MAIADLLYSQNTPPSVRSAIAWEPGNADFHALLAEHDESAGISPESELRTASELNPLSSLYLVRAAFRAEMDRDYPKAEQFLNRAVAVDHKFAPRWALLNFHFRRGSDTGIWPSGFWPVLNSALEMSSPEDTDAVFQLAWEQSQNSDAILSHLPADSKVREAYLRFLLRTDRILPAGIVARQLSVVESDSTALLLGYCDVAVNRDMPGAIDVWNALVARKLIAGNSLDPAKGSILTNKDFATIAAPNAFDWRIPALDGVLVTQADDAHGIVVRFDGSEPEDCLIAKQLMPVLRAKKYRIRYNYSSFGHLLRGIHWEAISRGKVIAASAEMANEADFVSGDVVFAADADSISLELHYQRPMGAVRADGSIAIRGLQNEIVTK